jgi:hypothetical protein
MDPFNFIPALNNYKTKIGAWALMVLGVGAFLVALGNLFLAVGHCMQDMDMQLCYDGVRSAWLPLVVAAGGLTGLGLGHKMEKAKNSPTK